MTKPDILLFDIGGVLVDFIGVEALHALTENRYGTEEIRRRWPDSPAMIRFETGRCTPQEFADLFLAEWRIALDREDFLYRFSTWPRALYAGAADLLSTLRADFTLACLSNINSIHWRRSGEELGVAGLFDEHFLSHEIGLRKPDRRIFQHVLDRTGGRNEAVAFFDDTPSNVEAARDFGLRAYHVQGIDGVRAALADLGISTD